MIINQDIFREYEALAAKADTAFQDIYGEYGHLIRCTEQCSDCCSSVFGLFLIESVYLNYHFNSLDRRDRRQALIKCRKADKDLLEVEKKLSIYDHDLQMKGRAMAAERVRCPLLDDRDKCLLYRFRPVTCRAYGVPTVIGGKIHACWKAGFEKEQAYPAFNLDGAYRELYRLSVAILQSAGVNDPERASLLVSVSKSVQMPVEELIQTSC